MQFTATEGSDGVRSVPAFKALQGGADAYQREAVRFVRYFVRLRDNDNAFQIRLPEDLRQLAARVNNEPSDENINNLLMRVLAIRSDRSDDPVVWYVRFATVGRGTAHDVGDVNHVLVHIVYLFRLVVAGVLLCDEVMEGNKVAALAHLRFPIAFP